MNFNLGIQGLGTIEEMDITIKPMTVIAGENSSGKTFATKSIYCVLEALNKNQLLGAFQEGIMDFARAVVKYEISLMPRISKVDKYFIEQLKEDSESAFNGIGDCLGGLSLLEHPKLEDLLIGKREYLVDIANNIKDYLSKRAGVAKIESARPYLERAIKILDDINETLEQNKKSVSNFMAKSLADNFKKNYQITNLSQLINTKSKSQARIKIEDIGELKFSDKDDILFRFAASGIDKIQMLEHVVFIDSPVYLKIRRGLDRGISRLRRNNFLLRELKGYPEYVDNLYDFIDREYIDKPADEFEELSLKLQHTISGKLEVNNAGEINYYDEKGGATPLSLTATGVSNLGLIDLLIRNNVIKKGSFLIIDEPEAHIHPKWQVFLMEVLFKMALAGANVIIATHSLDMLKKLELLAKNDSSAKDIISVHRMPQNNLPDNADIMDKIKDALDNLSTPFYEMYMEDNF